MRNGQLVAFPTETVYGLGANAFDENAVKSVFVAKGRPSDNPLIVHVANKGQISSVCKPLSPLAEDIVDAFMPGSLTVVLPKLDVVPSVVTAGLDTVAVRMPVSQEARDFISACGVPVAAPSANTSTRPSPTTWQAVAEDMDGKIAAILKGSPCAVGIESTVLDLTGNVPRILRPGIVTPSQIKERTGVFVTVVTNPKEKVNSPGVKYKHYAPRCPMVLNLDGDVDKLTDFYDQLKRQGKNPVLLVQRPSLFPDCAVYPLGETDEEVARNAFAALRACEKNYDYIIASFCGTSEVAFSVLNRLTKSAGQNIL